MESRSLGQLTSSCRHVTRERRASWSRDLSPPRDDGDNDDNDDDDDASSLEKRARPRSRDESHWLARPVGTGSLGAGTKETAVEEGDEDRGDGEGRRVGAGRRGRQRRRTVIVFLRARFEWTRRTRLDYLWSKNHMMMRKLYLLYCNLRASLVDLEI